MKPLLVVIDMQEGFRSPAAEAIIPAVKKLLAGFGGEIVFTSFKNEPGSLFETELHWTLFRNSSDSCRRSTRRSPSAASTPMSA